MKYVQDYIPEEQHIDFSKDDAISLLGHLRDIDTYNYFYYPVDPQFAESYDKIITTPMCIQQIERKMRFYSYMDEFFSDCRLICSNALTFNSDDSVIYKKAMELSDVIASFEERFYLVAGLGTSAKLRNGNISEMVNSLIECKSDTKFSDLQDYVIRQFLDAPVRKRVSYEKIENISSERVSANEWLATCEIPIKASVATYKEGPIVSLQPSRVGSEDED